MKPQKSDFQAFVQLSLNIEDKLINIHVEDAYKYDVKPKLGTLAQDIYNYTTGSKPQLVSFYQDYVLQWWVLVAYRRFLQVHGRNVTQFGYTKLKDPEGTFDQLDAEERAVILRQLSHDASVCYSLVLQQEWKFDNVTYRKPGGNCSPDLTTYGINAI